MNGRIAWRRRGAAAGLAAALAVTAAWRLVPPLRANLREYNASAQLYDCRGRLLRVVLGKNDVVSDPIPLDRSGDWAVRALIAGEDKRFYRHGGVDWLAAGRAAVLDAVSRRIVSGASTISMLVAKLTEPRPRTLWTKVVEARHARALEAQLTKQDILEQYLNRAPFGGNVVGIEAASKRYFGKSAADLTLAEAALLVGLPQSPARLRPDLHADRAAARRTYILERMKACGFITEAQCREASAQEVALAVRPLPFRAPHFCDLVCAKVPARPQVTTSLDLDVQVLAERALRDGVRALRGAGVCGGAVVVLDVRRGAVRALVGSPDYACEADEGQVDAAVARRSPGSALKPFVYAMALDEGLCSPHTVVPDIPVAFAGYRPENFDKESCGPISLRDALIRSRNVPALLLVQRLGLDNVVRRLRDLGIGTLDQRADHYGLSIAIGTCEVTLLDLANAYACLARLGVYHDATCLESAASAKGIRLFSEEAAYMVADMLSGDERALAEEGHVADVRLPRVAWKTGTSAGQRDAWCLAYNPEYVVGVWLGNPRGEASSALVGATAATPVAIGLFRQLYPRGDAPWFDRPRGLRSRQVCSATGQVPNGCCPATVADDYIPGITAHSVCGVHRTDAEPGDDLGAPAGGDADPRHVREVWPPDVQAFLASHGMRAPPSAAADPAAAAASVTIVSPARGETFRLADATPQLKQEIALRAVASAAPELHWFVDRRHYTQTAGGTPVYWPLSRGRHVIACGDGEGRGDSVTITVE